MPNRITADRGYNRTGIFETQSGTWLRLALVCLGPVLGLCAQAPGAAARLEAKIVDDATGEPLAAQGRDHESGGQVPGDRGQARTRPVPGQTLVLRRRLLRPAPVRIRVPSIEIRRGFETRPLSATIAGNGTGKTLQKTFRLRRWIDMRKKGYVNGDIHAHLPVPKEAHVQMRAEDLNAQVLLHVADSQNSIATNDCFTGKLDTHSTPGCEIYVGQEICEFQIGHLSLLNMTKLVPGYPDMGGGMEYWRTPRTGT